jgi:putative DNA primase/helicase
MQSAEKLAHTLGGRRVGRGWTAKCPAHQHRTPSLSIGESNDGKLLVCCHAGCEQAQVIAVLRDRGLWADSGRRHDKIAHPQSRQSAHDQRDLEDAKRTALALDNWRKARPIQKTIVENYLRSRGIVLDAWPEALRFHPNCPHPSGARLPALLAIVEHVERGPVAIHKTFLRADGFGKATVEPNKASLGPVASGAVRFGLPRDGEWLVIAEGIETTLSVVHACGLSGWAALSANGIKNLVLPREANHVLICADNDASSTGQRAARDSAHRFLREGRRVRIAMPPEVGSDFNTVLRSAAPAELRRGGA